MRKSKIDSVFPHISGIQSLIRYKMFYPNDDIFAYVYTFVEEWFDNYDGDPEDEIAYRTEWLERLRIAKHFRTFLDEEVFMDMPSGNIKTAIINTVMNEDSCLTDIGTYLENELEALKDAKAREAETEFKHSSTLDAVLLMPIRDRV